jgi:hypothetical protein
MFLLNGQPLPVDTPFEVDGTHYPANWLRLTSIEEKNAIGITEVPDEQVMYDDRFYWGVDNPKQLEDIYSFKEVDGEQVSYRESTGLKTQWIAQVKDTANKLMQPSDWMVLRQLLKGIGMSALVENYRDAVVAESNRLETAINACTDVPALVAVVSSQGWPVNGNN